MISTPSARHRPARDRGRSKSSQAIPGRAAVIVAERLGATPVTFPGDPGGFLGGEYGQTGEPDTFAATLHKVLAVTSP
jgi:hypothetical protein